MTNGKERKIRIGKLYEVKTPAGPKIHVKAIRIDPKEPYGFQAVIMRQGDLVALSNACVAWDPKKDRAGEAECFVFHHDVIKEVRGPYKKGNRRKSHRQQDNYNVVVTKRRGRNVKREDSS